MDGVINSMDMSLSKLQEVVKDREDRMLHFMGMQRAGHDLVTEQHQQSICMADSLCCTVETNTILDKSKTELGVF